MSAAITFDVVVMARDRVVGEERPAKVFCCSECGDQPPDPTLWILYTVNGHLHLQCVRCEETYCQDAEGCE